jgi:hypothetical protein
MISRPLFTRAIRALHRCTIATVAGVNGSVPVHIGW